MIAYADTQGLTNLAAMTGQVITIVGNLLVIAFACALLFFFWGLAVFIFKAGDDKAKEEGKNKMVYGVITLFVMASIWGIVNFIRDIVGVSNTATIPIPALTTKPP